MKTRFIKTTSGVDICEGAAWYAYRERLGLSHYNEFPIATDLDAFSEGSQARETLKKFSEYLDEGVIAMVRNQSPDLLMGGFLISSIGDVPGAQSPEHGFRFIICRSGEWECNCEGSCTDGCGVIADFPVSRSASPEDIVTRANAESEIAASILESALRLRQQGDSASETVKTSDGEEITFEYDSEEDRLRGVSFLQAVTLNPSDTQWWSYQTFPYWSSTPHQGTTGNVKNAGRKQLLAAYHNYDNRLETLEEEDTTDPTAVDGAEAIDVLGTDQVETLCTEYLRTHEYEGYQHVFPTGGDLQAADTLARTANGTRVATQVTMEGGKASKFRKLASFAAEQDDSGAVDLWYFGKGVDESDVPEDVEVKIEVRSIGDVFESMTDSVCLNAMLEVPDPQGEPATMG
ncbi:hypothetical protein [Halorientalis regularis]|uniref:Uncharacterized protein n=1 Tax=Halorientalis regularis TaxID=660518 RepID=A0A1G7GFD8_9EURY|nr:hypothetical protein [Halorientalis regularis]SDE86850.1 hypothetical protein SAMN05216218_10218 [Halorientalis regularis]